MTRIRTLKTNFTAGEVSPELLGRGDLSAFENGAARLRNVFIHPTGGITRRPGTRYVATARGRIDRIADGVTLTAPNGGTAAQALDDDPSTLLETTTAVGTTDPYVVVQYDLGSAQPVLFADAVGLRLTEGGSDGEFRIQHSEDGSAWTDLGAVTNVGTRAEGFRRTGPVTARYWRLARVGGADLGSATASLADFTLWADAGAVSPARAIAFEFNTEQTYLLVATDRTIAVYADGAWVADLPSPVDAGRIAQIAWAQSADTLLVVHPDLPPMRFTRAKISTGAGEVEDWKLSGWQFVLEDSEDADETPLGAALRQPYHKFADADVTVTPSGTTLDSSITLTASAAVFQNTHVGMRFRIEERQVEITAVSSPTSATATVKETLKSANPAKDWEEPALSSLRGWPTSVVFHQDRLVIGGSRDLPNRLWLSKSGDLFNFDLGEGLDDAAIEFAILSDQVNAVRNVFSGRHLQVLTSGAEWMVTGDPLTPENIQLKRQTRVGSPIDRNVPPRDVDGATLFAARNGRELREFLFADVEQAYQSNDLALLARHLLSRPQDQDYDQGGRLFHVVMADGTLATVTVYRAERVTAWSLQTTAGSFHAVCVVDDVVYLLVERAGALFIERFDAALATDAALTGTSETPQDDWSGLDHLEGETVAVVADGAVAPEATVASGAITLLHPAMTIEAGLPFTMEAEPLPPSVTNPRGSAQGSPIRLVEATFRLLNAKTLRVDTGGGYRDLPFRHIGESGVLDTGPVSFTGDLAVRALGWQRSAAPLWRIAQSAPLPCTILSVATEIKVND